MTQKKPDEHRTPFTLPIPGYGKRPLTSQDFRDVCVREGITVVRRRFTSSIRGLHYRQHGQPFIVIDSRLRGLHKIMIEFHELGHYFLHGGRKDLLRALSDKNCSPAQEWSEVEANMVALCALAPDFSLNTFNTFLQKSGPRIARRWQRKGRRP